MLNSFKARHESWLDVHYSMSLLPLGFAHMSDKCKMCVMKNRSQKIAVLSELNVLKQI